MKDRRADQANRRQRKRDGRSTRCGAVETLFFVLSAAAYNGKTEHQQHVTDDRSRQGGFHYTRQTFGKGDAGDDQLRGISESGIEQSSQALPDSDRQRFRRAPDPARNWNDAESGTNEERGWTDAPGPPAQKHRERNKNKKPVERGLEFQT